MIPASVIFDQSTLAALVEHDPLVADYRAFFASLEWSLVDQWQARRSPRGRPPHPEQAYLMGTRGSPARVAEAGRSALSGRLQPAHLL